MWLLFLDFLANEQSLERWEFFFSYFNPNSLSLWLTPDQTTPLKYCWVALNKLYPLSSPQPSLPPTYICTTKELDLIFFSKAPIFLKPGLSSNILWYYDLKELVDEIMWKKVEGKMVKKWEERWSARKMSREKNNWKKEGKMEQWTNKKWKLAHQQKREASGSPSADKIDTYFSVKLFFTLSYNEGRAIVKNF